MLLPVRGFHNGRDRCALCTPKQAQNFLLLRFGTRLGCDRFLFGTRPRLHLADGGSLRFWLCLDHFGLLSWIVTADRAATTTTPRRPSGAGGGRSELSKKSGAVMVGTDG